MTRHKFLIVALILTLPALTFAQATSSSQPGAGTRRNFTLFGDLKVDESQAGDTNTNVIFDVILYTRGNEVFMRQRVGNGGRYQFNNIFNGDYYLAVELDNVEIARMPVLIPANQPLRRTEEITTTTPSVYMCSGAGTKGTAMIITAGSAEVPMSAEGSPAPRVISKRIRHSPGRQVRRTSSKILDFVHGSFRWIAAAECSSRE